MMRHRAVAAGVLLAGTFASSSAIGQVREQQLAFNDALAAIEATEFERAQRILEQLVAQLDVDTPADLYTAAHSTLAALFVSIDSMARADQLFRRVVARDPFFELDRDTYNPDVQHVFDVARRTTVAIGLRVPSDTVIRPESDSWPVQVAVGRPGRAEMRLWRTDLADADTLVTARDVDSVASFSITFQPKDSSEARVRNYRLVSAIASYGIVDSAAIDFQTERLPVDTLPLEPPPPDTAYLPEVAKGPPPVSSMLKGVAFGAVAGTIPLLVTNSGLDDPGIDTRAVAVGAAISVGGLVGLIVGRRDVPIPENITSNQELRAGWQERNREIAAENYRLKLWAPIRITLLSER